MAHGPIKEDPAIERFNAMRERAYLNFRWTNKTVRTTLLGVVIVPGLIYYLASNYQAKWNWIGKRRGEPLEIGVGKG